MSDSEIEIRHIGGDIAAMLIQKLNFDSEMHFWQITHCSSSTVIEDTL